MQRHSSVWVFWRVAGTWCHLNLHCTQLFIAFRRRWMVECGKSMRTYCQLSTTLNCVVAAARVLNEFNTPMQTFLISTVGGFGSLVYAEEGWETTRARQLRDTNWFIQLFGNCFGSNRVHQTIPVHCWSMPLAAVAANISNKQQNGCELCVMCIDARITPIACMHNVCVCLFTIRENASGQITQPPNVCVCVCVPVRLYLLYKSWAGKRNRQFKMNLTACLCAIHALSTNQSSNDIRNVFCPNWRSGEFMCFVECVPYSTVKIVNKWGLCSTAYVRVCYWRLLLRIWRNGMDSHHANDPGRLHTRTHHSQFHTYKKWNTARVGAHCTLYGISLELMRSSIVRLTLAVRLDWIVKHPSTIDENEIGTIVCRKMRICAISGCVFVYRNRFHTRIYIRIVTEHHHSDQLPLDMHFIETSTIRQRSLNTKVFIIDPSLLPNWTDTKLTNLSLPHAIKREINALNRNVYVKKKK